MKTPSQEIFENIKEAATKVWLTKDNSYGYVTGKLETINKVYNISDNVMIFWRMFD